MPLIGIILGSDSDLPKVKECFETLDSFGVAYEVIVSSAHRSPEKTLEWVKSASERGIKVIIAIAGGAAHLPGVVASHTTLPVIGIPIETNIAGGLDSILSILQMPSGVPVATMAAGRSGGVNAALFALSILSTSDETIAEKLRAYRKKVAEKIEEKNKIIAETGLAAYIKKLEGKND
ncbi:MAG TPA: 5-(carboxyamino)imidazole ribonucleotide mutase [Spirochaetota bacterium]|nr:5-(carboxyamino)imidazole ribonucleotide mutase [Spirochaetota bacterium]HPP95973.1 5-(carboxyamino)imidazole ribonucleotide mutase [Spirochaetota bacterium]